MCYVCGLPGQPFHPDGNFTNCQYSVDYASIVAFILVYHYDRTSQQAVDVHNQLLLAGYNLSSATNPFAAAADDAGGTAQQPASSSQWLCTKVPMQSPSHSHAYQSNYYYYHQVFVWWLNAHR
jgi:hypothetical protein